MDINYKLVDERNWTAFLASLEPGISTVKFPSVKAIKSCKAVAYDINSDKRGRTYKFEVDKPTCSAKITVEVDGDEPTI